MTEPSKATDASNVSFKVMLFLAGLIAAVMIAAGGWLAATHHDHTLLSAGLLGMVIVLALCPVVVRMTALQRVHEASARQSELLAQLNERILISDHAKRIMFREKDRDALRDAIVQDIRKEDYDAALALVDEMAGTYGYREEAEQFRQQVLAAQAKRRDQIIDQTVEKIDNLCMKYEWELASNEVARLMRLFPDHSRVTELPRRIRAAREAHKHELEREFLAAAERDDIERAMDLIAELDRYLTPQEAKPYLETARGVVGKKKMNLGVQFKMSVQNRSWIEALGVGEQIIREFPNSMFADEVRGMLDVLRERAAGQRAAEQGRAV